MYYICIMHYAYMRMYMQRECLIAIVFLTKINLQMQFSCIETQF